MEFENGGGAGDWQKRQKKTKSPAEVLGRAFRSEGGDALDRMRLRVMLSATAKLKGNESKDEHGRKGGKEVHGCGHDFHLSRTLATSRRMVVAGTPLRRISAMRWRRA